MDEDAVDIDDDIFEGQRFQGHDLLHQHVTYRLFRSSRQSKQQQQQQQQQLKLISFQSNRSMSYSTSVASKYRQSF